MHTSLSTDFVGIIKGLIPFIFLETGKALYIEAFAISAPEFGRYKAILRVNQWVKYDDLKPLSDNDLTQLIKFFWNLRPAPCPTQL